MKEITLGTKIINEENAPYLIAEIGVNHEGSLETAKKLIELAKDGGADAAKFQSYKAETLASKHSPAYWDTTKESTRSQYELFKKYDQFGANDYRVLSEHCQKVGIDFVSTPFDEESIDFLNPLVPFYKIASADITNIPFLRQIAKKNKPVILSTGASTLTEIETAIYELKQVGCNDLALLHCVLNYPTEDCCAHLNMISGLQKHFPDYLIGYSDHTLPDPKMLVMGAAYAKGAKILEKHFTQDKSLPGNDHYHAMDVDDLRTLKENLERLTVLGGDSFKHPLPTEKISREHARRSIVLKKTIAQNTILFPDMLTCKRPAHGVSPLHWDEIIGKTVVRQLEADHILTWSDLK